MARDRLLEEELRKKAYLVGETLFEKEFIPSFPGEYAVCVFCWGHISDNMLDYNEGFQYAEGEDWICPRCFEKYTKRFEWKMIPMKRKSFLEYLAEEEDLEIPMI